MNSFVAVGSILYNIIIIAVVYIWIVVRKKRSEGRDELVLSNRELGWLPCAAALALTSLGGGHINGLSFVSWDVGVGTVAFSIGTGLSMIFVLRFAGVWYRRTGCVTVCDLFGKMFHPLLQPLLGAIGVAYCWTVLCVETQGMAPIISLMTGLTNFQAGLVGAIIGILYVILAGMREIGYVNVWNAILMYVFGFIALGYAVVGVPGGLGTINNTLLGSNPELVAALGNPTIIRTYIIGTFLSCALGLNMVQPSLQPAAAVDSVKVLRKACTAAIPMNAMFGAIIVGLALVAKAHPETMAAPNGVAGMLGLILTLPTWVQVGTIGVFLGAILSTFAMVVLAGVTMWSRDILGHYSYFQKMPVKKENTWFRIWILIFALSGAFAAVTIQASTNLALTWGFAWNTPLFFVFIIGLFWKRSSKGSLTTLIICWAVNMLLTFTPLASVFGLEGNNYSIFTMILSVVVGLITTGLDKNAKPSLKATYIEQRAKYDAGGKDAASIKL